MNTPNRYNRGSASMRTPRRRPAATTSHTHRSTENGYNRERTSSAHTPSPRPFTRTSEGRSYAERTHRRSSGRAPQQARKGRFQKVFDVSKFINKNPVAPLEEEVYAPKHTFETFGLNTLIVGHTKAAGLTSPTPIQDQIIPHIMDGKDVIGLANTGTGKTAAFLLPLIHKTMNQGSRTTLILTPTRELAIQIENELKKFSHGCRMFATICVGGTAIRPQIYGLKRHNHFIIGTPGRIRDLIERGVLKTSTIRTLVLDEADRMLDMGFIHDMRAIIEGTPKDRETLFFSATMSDDIKKLVHDFLRDPVTISVKKNDITSSIVQDVVPFTHSSKFETLTTLLQDPAFKRVLIFGGMKHSVEKLAQQLIVHKIKAESIHGNKSHPQRQRSLTNFKSGNARVLVATDVAARGIHVDNVSHVINYDLPATYEDYVHRIGRTGRGKERGIALTFVER